MPHILLLGAGFSRNWGGWLASEIGDALLQRVADDRYLSDILNRCPAFEDALSLLQGEASSGPQGKERLGKFENAIVQIFTQMNRSFAQRGNLDFSSVHKFSIEEIPCKIRCNFYPESRPTVGIKLPYSERYRVEGLSTSGDEPSE